LTCTNAKHMTMLTKPDVRKPFLRKPLHMGFAWIFSAFWIYSGFTTPDLLNWLLENTLTLTLIIFLAAFYNIFRFSDTSYTLIFLFLLLHVYGSQYQYPDNPLGEWLKENYGLSRNPYDRFVHLGFGLLLAYPMHEVLAYGFNVKRFLSYLLPVEIVLSLSALYELLEWVVADLVFKEDQQGMAYLGAQGDVWDAQKDIGLAFAGALVAMGLALLLHRYRQQKRQTSKPY
jgi:putative membrane protein